MVKELKETKEGSNISRPALEEDRAANGEVGRQVLQTQSCLRLPVGYRDEGASRGIGELQHLDIII